MIRSLCTTSYWRYTITLIVAVVVLGPLFSQAQFNPEINYQAKLTDDTGMAVTNGNYDIVFRLYTAASGGSPIWTESRTGSNQVTVTNGLFSVMLGDVASLASVDFNQTLYLGVTVGADSEMSPRKVLGAVPAAFVAETANELGGVASSSFLRSDQADVLEATSASTLLTVTQNGAGNILDLLDGATNVFTVRDGGNVGIGTTTPGSRLTVAGDVRITGALRDSSNSAGTNGFVLQTTGSGTQWVATSTLGFAAASSVHDAVTITGENYLSLSGQQITANAINLASTNVTGTLPVANGGTGAVDAPGARTNLGATTVGSNFFTLTNPTAVRFVRINADNTVSALDATDFRNAIGAGTGGGSVNSVALAAPTGFTVSGSPVTASGTLTFAYDTGYGPVLTASTTNWDNFYNTPSTRITAGDGIDWSANTLNVANVTAAMLASADFGSFTCNGTTCALDASTVGATEITDDTISVDDINNSATLAGNPTWAANSTWFGSTGIIFEGSTANDFEGLLTATNPTADRTWTLPNADGTVALTTSAMTGTFDGNNFAGGAIGIGDLLYGSAAGAISELAIGTTGQVLQVVGGLPVWVATSSLGFAAASSTHDAVTITGENYLSLSGQQITANAINLAGTNVTGTLPVTRGGTGITAFGTGVATALGINVGTAGSFITNGGALGTPSSGTLTNATGLPIVGGTTGTLTVGRGGTGLTTFATGDLIYASGANTLAARTIGTAGQVLQVVGGVPQWVATSTLGITGVSTLTALTDTTITSPVSGEILQYNGSVWVNVATSTLGFGSGSLFTDGGATTYLTSLTDNLALGTTTATARLSMERTGYTGTGVVGLLQDIGVAQSATGQVAFGSRTNITNSSTATTTIAGGFIRITDNTTFGNTIRGLEVQADLGTNTQGENTGISSFGRTFGIRGTTNATAGGDFDPAGVFAELTGGTQGNALRAYSNNITSATLVNFLQESTTFTGTGLLMDFAQDSGTFTGNFLDLRDAGTTRFSVAADGDTYISGNLGVGTTTPSSKLDVWGDMRVGTSSVPTLFVNSLANEVVVNTINPTNNLEVKKGINTGSFDLSFTNFDNAAPVAAMFSINDGGTLPNRLASSTASIERSGFIGTGQNRSGTTLSISENLSASIGQTGTVSGSLLNVSRTNGAFSSGTILNVSGTLASYADSCSPSSGGVCNSTSDVLQLSQAAVSNTGATLNITTASTNGGLVFRANDDGTLTDSTPTVIDANGNVGIGTTSPSSKLTVAGDVRITGALRDSNNSAGTSGFVLQSTGSGTQWVATSTLGIGGGSSVTFGTDNQIPFMNAGGTDFEYSSNFTFDGSLVSLGGTGLSLTGTTANIALGSNWLSGDGADEGVYVDSAGRVGIGTSTIQSGNALTTGGSVWVNGDVTVPSTGGFLRAGGSRVYLQSTDNIVAFYTNGAEVGRFNEAAGNLGIGDIDPDARLEVSGNGGTVDLFMLSSNDDSDGNIMLVQDTGEVGIGKTVGLVARLSVQATGTADILNLFESGGSEVLTVLESGDVGIGTTSPSSKLTVAGDVRITGALRDSNNSAGTSGFVLQSTGTGFAWVATSTLGIGGGASSYLSLTDTPGAFTANRIPFTNTGATALTDSANFTFNGTTNTLAVTGSTTISNTLTVEGVTRINNGFGINIDAPVSGGLYFNRPTGGDPFINFFEAGSQIGQIRADFGERRIYVSDATGATQYLTVNTGGASAGNVGIGSSTPSSRLTVVGDVFISGALRDNTGSAGTTGFVLQSTGTGFAWVATSTLGITGGSGSVTFGTDNQIPFMNSGGTDFEYASTLTYNGTDLNLGGTNGIAFGGTRVLSASTTLSNYLFGQGAGDSITSGTNNIAIGGQALENLITGTGNVAVGITAGRDTTGDLNTFIGNSSGFSNTSGGNNTFVGYAAGFSNTTGGSNSLFGDSSGNSLVSGSENTFLGQSSALNLATSSRSVVVGMAAAEGGTAYAADHLVVFGYRAGASLATGANNNLLLGYQAADSLTTGANNIIIGYDVEAPSNTGSNQLNIGNLLFGTGIDGTGTTLSTGNIGIGTSSPSAKLTVAGDSLTTGRQLVGSTVDLDGIVNFGAFAGATTDGIMALEDTFSDFSFNSVAGMGLVMDVNPGTNYVGVGTGVATGIANYVETRAGNSFNLNQLAGTDTRVNNSGNGDIDTVAGQFINITNTGTGNIIDTFGLFIGDITSGSQTNVFSIYADDVNAPSYFGGDVGIGTTTPRARLSLQQTGITGAGVSGIDQYLDYTNSTASAVMYGNYAFNNFAPTATSTLVANMIRVADNTTLGNTVRGLEVQVERGVNTFGENTAISGFARTFGVRGVTEADAGGSFEPAGGFFESRGTTQGNAIRGYSGTVTSAALMQLFQDTSAFTGTGLLMNFGNAGGSFSSTTASRFIDLQNAGSSRFTVGAYGMLTIGNGGTTNSAGIQIGYGGLCVDNDGACTANVNGRIASVSQFSGNSDLAEMYFSSENLLPGEIVYAKGGLSIGRADEDTAQNIIGVVSTKPGVLLGYDDTSLVAGEEGYPVALSGRVPIRLSNENGPIEVGDELMLSSIPGVAMKATSTGKVIGTALEAFNEARAYSDTYINQFGDDIADPVYTPVTAITDPRINDGCYYGGGAATNEAPCVPLTGTTTDAQVLEAEQLAAAAAQTEALEALRYVPSESVTLEDGETVQVGQIVMFVDLRTKYMTSDSVAFMEALMGASTTVESIGGEDQPLFERVLALASRFVDGVLSVLTLKADRVETNELCVDGVCVTADDLRRLLDTAPAAAVESTNGGSATGGSQTAPDTTESDTATEPNDATDTETITEPVATSTTPAPEAETTEEVSTEVSGVESVVEEVVEDTAPAADPAPEVAEVVEVQETTEAIPEEEPKAAPEEAQPAT